MYYNSNRVNNDYYHAYRQEVSKLQNERKVKIIKYVLLLLLLLSLLFASYYFYAHHSASKSHIDIKEEELPVSIQLLESTIDSPSIEHQAVPSSIKKKDIEVIVKAVMNQMKRNAKKSLETQLQEANKKVFVEKSLKEVDHYNKVIVPNNNNAREVEHGSLMQLQHLVNNIQEDRSSHYTQEIQKEIIERKNEMRIIVVKKGDTLSKIAKRAYGNYADYKKIFAANPEIIRNPNQIYVGQRLRIPS